ncbi:hypothetical protein BH23THE1_BH23THE1_27590 [soil metagenome]
MRIKAIDISLTLQDHRNTLSVLFTCPSKIACSASLLFYFVAKAALSPNVTAEPMRWLQ